MKCCWIFHEYRLIACFNMLLMSLFLPNPNLTCSEVAFTWIHPPSTPDFVSMWDETFFSQNETRPRLLVTETIFRDETSTRIIVAKATRPRWDWESLYIESWERDETETLWEGGICYANLGWFKVRFSRKTGERGGVRQSGKFPDYTGFFLLKAFLMWTLKSDLIWNLETHRGH